MSESYPFPDPRLRGIQEHLHRVRRSVQLARRCKKPSTRFRHLISTIYSARAITELMITAAKQQELKTFRNADPERSGHELATFLAPKVPYYYLIEKIRIHDFHRFGCVPPDPKIREVFGGGPIKLVARQGTAAYMVTAQGPKVVETGKSRVKQQRPLVSSNGEFFDDKSESYVSLDTVLDAFLKKIPSVIAEFGRLASD